MKQSNQTGTSRRRFLEMTAIGGAVRQAAVAGEQTVATRRGRIDVHHHMLPSFQPNLRDPNWTPETSLEAMDKYGCEVAILSFVIPPEYIYDGSEKARALVRRANEYGARVVSGHPRHLGFFAALPLRDIAASLKEIEYAFDTLHCDGAVLMTNAGDKWPGDPLFAPVFDELNRRKSAVFFHPAVPNCCMNLVPGIHDATLEYEFDTTRAITSLLLSGTLSRCQDVRWVVNHSGAAVPALSGRIKNAAAGRSGTIGIRASDGKTEKIPNGVLYELRRLYYECATATYPAPMAALRAFAPPTQYLFGTDFPVVHYETTMEPFSELKLPADVQYALDRGNAERLWPRLH